MPKCQNVHFGKEQVEYLGHIISKKGVKVDPKKIKEITKWPNPKTYPSLEDF
jgi:hypothetical protein